MICPKCKQQISKTDKFCFNCGYKLDNNINNKWYKNSKIHVISLLILALIIVSVLTIPHFINNKTTNTNHKSISTQPIENKTNSVINDIKAQTNSASSEAKNNGITPDEAKQELINLYNNANIIFLNGTTFSANQIKGADELIGKYCYLFGFEGGNGIFYIVDSQNGKTYECVSNTAGVLTLEADTYKNKNNGTTANINNVNKDNTINQNNNIQQINNNQNNSVTSNSSFRTIRDIFILIGVILVLIVLYGWATKCKFCGKWWSVMTISKVPINERGFYKTVTRNDNVKNNKGEIIRTIERQEQVHFNEITYEVTYKCNYCSRMWSVKESKTVEG